MCKKGGAECVPLTIGDYEITGMEWDDPHCWHMACRKCMTVHMAKCDLSNDIDKQRCRSAAARQFVCCRRSDPACPSARTMHPHGAHR